MNNHARMKTLLLSTVLLAPLLAHSATENDGLNNCAQSLAERIETAQNAPLKFSVVDKNPWSSQRIRSSMTFTMQVIDAKSDNTLFHAGCTVDRSGRVQRLTTTPLVVNNDDE